MDRVVSPTESVIRLLFHDRMVTLDGDIGPEAFPADELAENGGKSCSVDRLDLVEFPLHIVQKLNTFENSTKNRSKWGCCEATCAAVHSITSQCNRQVFCVVEDPIHKWYPPAPWAQAHACVVLASREYSKGFVRGYRDKLIEAFEGGCHRMA